ncbi:MAG: hypothetical protein L0H53_09120 [Candidatus Nitrosocosmicus sp.]|nr:hypothetical protein [Candidatus Nitrosocosmicus sp.]MDN5868797.1 hypothetical protein [Candidatus Nitrosocosmicus sp.]
MTISSEFKSRIDEERKIINSENTCDETTLWRIHDVYRGDAAVSKSLNSIAETVVGRSETIFKMWRITIVTEVVNRKSKIIWTFKLSPYLMK